MSNLYVIRKLDKYLTGLTRGYKNQYIFGRLIDAIPLKGPDACAKICTDIRLELKHSPALCKHYTDQWVVAEKLPEDIFISQKLYIPHIRFKRLVTDFTLQEPGEYETWNRILDHWQDIAHSCSVNKEAK